MLQLVEKYKKARQELITWIGLVPAEKRETKCAGNWSLKDILSHLIGWTQFQNQVVSSLLAAKVPEDMCNIFQFNTESVNHRKNRHWDKIYKEFLNSTEKLLSAYLLLPKNLWKKPVWPKKKITMVKLIKIETRHYQGEHLNQIKKLLNVLHD